MVDSCKENMSSESTQPIDILSTLKRVLLSIHSRSTTYHYKLVGDDEECLSTLLGIEDVHFLCILSLCGLYDINNRQHNIFDMRIFDPCETIVVSLRLFGGNVVRKQRVYFVKIGTRDNPGMTGPLKQYHLRKPTTESKSHHHVLNVQPPKIRLNRDELNLVDNIKASSSSMIGTLSRSVVLRRSAKEKEFVGAVGVAKNTRRMEQLKRKETADAALAKAHNSLNKFLSLPKST